MEVTFEEIQKKLSAIDVRSFTEKKSDGMGHELTYLSWSYAWGELIKVYPSATYEIERFGENKLPYLKTEEGYMVFTKVTICGNTREMWLSVMDSHNEAMKEKPYEIARRNGSKIVIAAADMNDINKTIMRCLVKNIAMFGLGLNVYQGEDLPNVNEAPIVTPEEKHVCASCGKEIVAFKGYGATQIANMTKATYGKELCYDCASIEKRKKQALTKDENEGEN